MMRSGKMAVALLWLAACGSDGDSEHFDKCTPAQGSYRVSYTEKSGDCGVGHLGGTIPIGGASVAQCTGDSSVSDNGCTTNVNARCVDENRVATKTVGNFQATKADGSEFKGSATVTLTLADGDTCVSLFDTTGTKL